MFTQFKHLTWKAGLLATIVSLLAFTVALAAPGDLDTTFSGDGKVVTDISAGSVDWVGAIAIQSNGKILVGGSSNDDIVVARYNPNGTLDTTFSGDGKQITNFGGAESAEEIAIQSNGKIVVTGTSCLTGGWPDGDCDAVVARYNSGGALDATFNADGKLRTDFGGGTNGTWGGLSIQSDGKIVVAGYMHNGANFDIAAYRYNTNGTLDTTFSGDGMVKVAFPSGPEDLATDLVIQSGKIVLGGVSCDVIGLVPWENCDFAIARFNANGTLDTTFSGDGRQIINFGGVDLSDSMALQSNGKIVLAGFRETPTDSFFALARLNPNGALDISFNGTGKVVTGFGAGSGAHGRAVHVQTNGNIIVAGQARGNFALARYTAAGALDTTFSGDGRVLVNFGFEDIGWVLALQPSDGKYVLGGTLDDGTQRDFGLARLLP
jgi:uncharacterized delta-60 repeat protein